MGQGCLLMILDHAFQYRKVPWPSVGGGMRAPFQIARPFQRHPDPDWEQELAGPRPASARLLLHGPIGMTATALAPVGVNSALI
jgi:hypothetical protein